MEYQKYILKLALVTLGYQTQFALIHTFHLLKLGTRSHLVLGHTWHLVPPDIRSLGTRSTWPLVTYGTQSTWHSVPWHSVPWHLVPTLSRGVGRGGGKGWWGVPKPNHWFDTPYLKGLRNFILIFLECVWLCLSVNKYLEKWFFFLSETSTAPEGASFFIRSPRNI